jgi:outer membrane protein assembly factor BamB
VGPKAPTIDWSIRFDPNDFDLLYHGSPIQDASGRIYLCVKRGLTAIDSTHRTIAWSFVLPDSGDYSPAYDSGVVVFGSPTDSIYGVDAETGQQLWSFSEPNRPNLSPVAADGVVYYITQGGDIKTRRSADGQLLWARTMGTDAFFHPALDLEGGVFSGSYILGDARSLAALDGTLLWARSLGGHWVQGTAPVLADDGAAGRVYVMDQSADLHCLNRLTGEQKWVLDLGQSSWGIAGAAVGHDGTVYAGVFFGTERYMYAVTPDGDILWQYHIGNLDGNYSPAIIDGDGTIYFTTFRTQGRIGRVHALNPDGSVLWIKDMPERVASSPMLAPDGTLYVNCSDTYLYAFKDPCPADFNGDGAANTLDVLAFLNAWVAGDARADFNGDGSINTLDVLAFLNAWGAGCA